MAAMRSLAFFKGRQAMKKASSRPRRIAVSLKGEPKAMVYQFNSVSEASRATGIGREHIHGILSGRTGSRHQFRFEYA